MVQMMKRDFLINKMYFVIVAVIVPLIYIVNVSPMFTFIGIMIGCIFNLFYYDDHNYTNRYIISLPVSRKGIVLSRYIFVMTVTSVLLIYLWVIDTIAHTLPLTWITKLDFNPINLSGVMLTLLVITLIASVSMPIYYFFQSFMKSIIAQGILFFTAVLGFAFFGRYLEYIPEKFITGILAFIDLQPLVFLIVFLIVCFTLSYKISTWIFFKKILHNRRKLYEKVPTHFRLLDRFDKCIIFLPSL